MKKSKKFRGKVIKRVYGKSSKSEHDAVMLVTDDQEFKLRRVGGNPFRDKVLDDMVGLEIECQGSAVGSTLIFNDWSETDDASDAPESKKEASTKTKTSTTKKTTKKRSAKSTEQKKSTKKSDRDENGKEDE